MFGFEKKDIGLKDKPELQEPEEEKKMLWEITDEIIERSDRKTVDMLFKVTEEKKKRGLRNKRDRRCRYGIG